MPDCSVRKACEMMDILNEHIEIEFDQSNWLSELLWNQIDFPPSSYLSMVPQEMTEVSARFHLLYFVGHARTRQAH